MLQQHQHSPPPASSSGDSASSTGTASSDTDRQNRARIQAYYVTHEPFQLAHLKKERERVELETVRAEAAELERGVTERKVAQGGRQEVTPVIESTINLASQQSNSTTSNPLEQVPPPFVLPDTTTNVDPQPQAPPIAAVGLPLIVSSSAESNDAPQVVNAPEHEQPTNNESSPPAAAAPTNASTGSASSSGSASGGKSTSAESNTGTGTKLGGLLSNWAPGVALKRPLSMQRSLSGFFGLKSSGIAESTTTTTTTTTAAASREEEQAGGEGGRKMSRGSMTSDESSLLVADEGGKSGVVYRGVDGKSALADATAAAGGWNAGERRRRLPDGASGIVLHKDLWKLDQMSETCDLPECSTVFSFTNRRHHCRMCGQIFCTPHASYALDLWYPPTGTSEEGLRSGMTSRRGSADELQQGVSRSPNEAERAMQGSEVTASLLRLPARRNVGKDGVVKPSRVCVDCYDRVWNPGKLAGREKARRAVHDDGDDAAVAISATGDVNDSDSQASHSGFSLVLESKAAVNNSNDRVLQRSRSAQGTGRRMFSAPTSPASTSPTTNQGNALDGAVVGLAMNDSVASLNRTGSRASSLAPPGAKQNRRLARNASAHGALSLPPPLRSGSAASDSITPRPMFSPTAEALNIHAQQRSSLSPNSSAGANGYFPAMPPPSKAFLPGEEPNQHVNGVLSNYPLAYKPASSGSTVTSPFTSRPPSSADLSGMARRMAGQGTTRQVPAHMRIDLPNGGYAFDDPLSSKASSARLLTPEREWVPGAWGYARETFDPDVESETEDEDDELREVDSLAKRSKSRLIVDGDIRLKTRASDVRQTATGGDHTASHVQSSTGTRLMPWSTF